MMENFHFWLRMHKNLEILCAFWVEPIKVMFIIEKFMVILRGHNPLTEKICVKQHLSGNLGQNVQSGDKMDLT
jgi:hypothetical protein